jgi:hypothetical protein
VIGSVVLAISAYLTAAAGISLFIFGFILVQLGLTSQGVVVAALVSDFSELSAPSRKNLMTSLFYLFFNLGAVFGVAAPSVVLPITATSASGGLPSASRSSVLWWCGPSQSSSTT